MLTELSSNLVKTAVYMNNGADFMFLNEINAGDKIRFTALQNSGSVIQVSGGCRLNIIRMGK